MALARTDLLGARFSLTGDTGTSASFTPPANSLLVVSVFHFSNNDDSAGFSISGGGLTYTSRKIQDAVQGGFGGSITAVQEVWTAPVGGSPSSMTVAIQCPGGNPDIIVAHIVAYTGYDTGSPVGVDGSFRNAFNTTPDTASASITLSGNPASTSDVFASICCGANNAAGPVTVGTGWTEIYDFVDADPNALGFQSQHRTGSTSSAVGWDDVDTNNVTSGLWGCEGYALEIKEAGGAAAAPIVPNDTATKIQVSHPISLRTWTASYNPNLVGKDALPPGRKGILYDDPSRGYLPPGQTWTSRYNDNLIGKDVLPAGRRNPIFEEVQPILWRRDWTLNLLQGTLAPSIAVLPFRQRDWPIPRPATQPDRSWVSSAATLQVMLPPPGDIWTDLPPTSRFWRRDWSQNLILSTLVAQDQLPPGATRYDRPQPITWLREWSQNLLLSTLAQNQFPPGAAHYDRPRPVTWSREWSQNLVLSTLVAQDQLPPGAVRYDRPQPITWSREWSQSLLLSTLAPPAEPLPFNQYDWPLPARFFQPDRSYIQTQNPPFVDVTPAFGYVPGAADSYFYDWWRRQRRLVERAAESAPVPTVAVQRAVEVLSPATIAAIDSATTGRDIADIAATLAIVERKAIEALILAADEAERQEENESVAAVFLSLM